MATSDRTVRVVAILLLLVLHNPSHADFGSFVGDVETKWRKDGRTMVLLNPFSYRDTKQRLWTVPKGYVVDGATIPQAFWTVVGSPYSGSYRRSSIIHDYLCDENIRKTTWQRAHKIFYEGSRADRAGSVLAKLMYFAVMVGGPRWEDPGIDKVPENFSETEVTKIKKIIEQNEPSLAQLEALAEKTRLEGTKWLDKALQDAYPGKSLYELKQQGYKVP